MLTLLDHPLSPYAQKVKIALNEKGVPFEAPLPGSIGSGAEDADFSTANPRMEVPTLIDEGNAIYDSTIILEYIEDKWPEPSLLPLDPIARARVRTIEDVMDTHFEGITWGLGEITFFGRGSDGTSDKLRSNAELQLQGWYRWLESELGEADWFNGTEFGWGDLAVVPFVNGAAGFELGPPASSRLGQWLARANERDSVATVAEAARAMTMADNPAGMQAVREAMDAGLFKREYRDHRLEWMIKSGGLSVVADGLSKDNIRFTPVFGE